MPHQVAVRAPNGQRNMVYDRLVVAARSHVYLPDIPGLAKHGLNIDTYDEAERLERHLKALSCRAPPAGRDTVLVIGAGLTGIEAACHMPDRLKAAGIGSGRVLLTDWLGHIGSDVGERARPVIDQALEDLGVETRTTIEITAVDNGGVMLTDDKRIAADTIVWCASLVASPLAACLPGERWGRLSVN